MSDQPPFVRNFVLNSNKVAKYLLVQDHPQNQGKAGFFYAFGFTPDRSDLLAFALLGHVKPEHFVRAVVDRIGATRLIYEGPIDSPDERHPWVRTVWQMDDEGKASFVTSVPLSNNR